MRSDEVHFRVTRLIQEHSQRTLRELARHQGVSPGKANNCLKALIEKGLVNAEYFRRSDNKLAYVYLRTPVGIEEKARITVAFLRRKMQEFEVFMAEIEGLQTLAVDVEDGRTKPVRSESWAMSDTVTAIGQRYVDPTLTGQRCRYVVSCKPRQGFGVYLPRIRVRQRCRDRWVESVRVLFPHSLFVHVDRGARSTASIRSTRGTIGLVRFGGEPAVVPNWVIGAAIDREQAAEVIYLRL